MEAILSIIGISLGLGFLTGCTLIGMIVVCKGLTKLIISKFR